MINANELRMGNWINYLDINGVNPAQIEIDDFINLKEDGENDFPFTPIPLTPEILEKCGLKNGNSELDRNVFYSTNKHLAQFSVNISGSFGIYVGVFIALRSVHLEYLHQLQNLYFALCGEELNYTP